MDKIWWKYFVCASSIISSASGHSNGSIYCHIIISFVFLLRINFYCCIVTSQCCVGLYCSATWIRHTHIYPPFWVHPLRTPRCSKQNSVPYTAVSHQLSTLYILSIVYMYVCVCVCVYSGHHSVVSWTLGAVYSSFSSIIYFIHTISSMCVCVCVCVCVYTHICVNPNLPIPPLPLGTHLFVLYVCVSITGLQIRSSMVFIYIPHIWVIHNIVSVWFTSLCMILSRSIHMSTNDPVLLLKLQKSFYFSLFTMCQALY